METKTCQQCSQTFERDERITQEVWSARRFCSLKCYGQTRRALPRSKTCKVCKTEFFDDRREGSKRWARRKYCSTRCAFGDRKGPNHHLYKGGGRFEIQGGYIATRLWVDHPFFVMAAKSNRRVLEHRLVMAEHLGRSLEKSETVHHINGDRADNRIENLQLRTGRHGKGRKCVCADCGSENILEVAL